MPLPHNWIRGAQVHDPKNVSLDQPRNRLAIITRLSGSGRPHDIIATALGEAAAAGEADLSALNARSLAWRRARGQPKG